MRTWADEERLLWNGAKINGGRGRDGSETKQEELNNLVL